MGRPVHPLKRLGERLVFLEKRRQRSMTKERGRAAKQKVIFGTLVQKAGLENADRAFLLGALIEASRIPEGTAEHERLRTIGMDAFLAEARCQLNSESKDPS
jgi:hypothetical protein